LIFWIYTPHYIGSTITRPAHLNVLDLIVKITGEVYMFRRFFVV